MDKKDNSIHKVKTVGILGATGIIGELLTELLRQRNFSVLRGSRSLKNGYGTQSVNIDDAVSVKKFVDQCNIVINCTGPSLLTSKKILPVIIEAEKDYIIEKIKEKRNILIIGGTSSGKTTFINACLNEFKDSDTRFIILEDTAEIQCMADDTVKLKTTKETPMNDLSASSMRLNPEIMIVGEMRSGDEVLALLEVWNTGHSGGMSTIHANDCEGGLLRLQQLLMNYKKIEPSHSISFIVKSVHILINIQKVNGKRKITEIAETQGYDYVEDKFKLEYVKGGDNGNSIL